MVSSIISIKAALIFTGIAAMSLFLKSSVNLSRFPILWSSFLSWLEPPYLFVAINVIITIIIASSKYYQIIEDDQDVIDYKIQIEPPIVNQAPPRLLEVKDMDLDANFDFVAKIPPPILVAEVVFEEKEEEISGLIDCGNEVLNQVPSMIESENLPPAEKPLVSARSGHRKPVKASSKGGGNKKKALRVVKPKRHESIEDTWMVITEEGKSTKLTSHFWRSDTFGIGACGDVRPVLRKAETFRDVTNLVTAPPVKMKKEMSPSREELNRRVEAFIKKCKEERLESLKLEKQVV